MSLLKEIEDTKAQLAEALEAEKEEPAEESEEEATEEQESEQPAEAPKPEAVEEKPAESVKEEKLDDSAYAKMRRELAAERRKREEIERENVELKKPKDQEAEQESSPIAAELEQVIQESRKGRAENEFRRYESEVTKAAPENAAIMAEYTQAIQGSIRLNNPRMSPYEIAELTKLSLFQKAGKYQNEGYANPVEEMLHEAKELGFTGKSFARKAESEADPKPNMAKVAENRKRSAGMTGASGREDGLVSKKTAAEMSPAEWKAVDRAERQRLMSA